MCKIWRKLCSGVLERAGQRGFAHHGAERRVGVGLAEVAQGDFAVLIGGEFAGAGDEAGLLALAGFRQVGEPFFAGLDVD